MAISLSPMPAAMMFIQERVVRRASGKGYGQISL